MALEQNQQDVWRVTGFWSGTINMHQLTGNIVDSEMLLYSDVSRNDGDTLWEMRH
jgi:hypothetical protein